MTGRRPEPATSSIRKHATSTIRYQLPVITQSRFSLSLTTCTKHDPDIYLYLLASDGNWRDIITYTTDLRGIGATGIGQAVHGRGEYLLRFHARVVDDSSGIFEKDHLKVVDTRDAETPCLLSNISFLKSPLWRFEIHSSIGLSKLVRSVQANRWHAYTLFTLLEGIYWLLEQIDAPRAWALMVHTI
jgi:hypothetical protein